MDIQHGPADAALGWRSPVAWLLALIVVLLAIILAVVWRRPAAAPVVAPFIAPALVDNADAGHASAMLAIGKLYENGLGVPKDYGQALAWFRQAAAKGSTRAEAKLAEFYRGRMGSWRRRSAERALAGKAVVPEGGGQ